jgi:toxin FitB
MKYLLDTCVISELAKPKASQKVVDFVSKENEENLFISTLTFGELIKGIEKLPESAKKDELYAWVENDLKERFGSRIIEINIEIAETWGKIQAAVEKRGKPMSAVDSLIAATGIACNLTVVTRNVADMAQSGVLLFNPWE